MVAILLKNTSRLSGRVCLSGKFRFPCLVVCGSLEAPGIVLSISTHVRISSLTKRFIIWPLIAVLGLILVIATLTILSIPIARTIKNDRLLAPAKPQSLLIKNVHIVDTRNGDVASDLTHILIDKGHIKAVMNANVAFDLLSEARVIDGKSAFLSPGLIDMHAHIYDRSNVVASLSAGVTTLRLMRGEDRFLRWRDEIKAGEWLGSRLIVSSPILDGPQGDIFDQAISDPEEGRRQVRLAKAKGYDLIKAYGYLPAAVFQAIHRQAIDSNIPLAKHGPIPIEGLDWKSLQGLQSLEHVEDIFQGPLAYQFDAEQVPKIVEKIKALNVAVTPTLETFHHLTRLSSEKQTFVDSLDLSLLNPFYAFLLEQFSVKRWMNASNELADFNKKEMGFLLVIVAELHRQGVPLLVGSDFGTMFTLPGIATHNELDLLLQAGLPPADVLKAATIEAARVLGKERQLGSVEVGKKADLILTKQNPLINLSTLREPLMVLKDGHLLDKSSLKQLRKLGREHLALYWSFVNFVDDILLRHLE